jgi:Concanavalin A-like lectin/glucanases superfamily/Secretion system C-terminal sorting domain
MKNLFFIIVLLLVPTLLTAQGLTQGLVGWWPFTGNAVDSVNMQNNGKVTGAQLTKDRFGNDSSAYYFDGNGDYIDVGTDSSLRSSSHSINFWFKYKDTSQVFHFVDCQNSNNGEWGSVCYYHPSNGLSFSIGAGSNDRLMGHASYIKLNDDDWHMFSATYSKTTNQLAVYLDGCLSGNVNIKGSKGGFSSSDSTRFNSGEHWMFGAHSQYFSSSKNNGPRYFKGSLDDIRMYNRPLGSVEVRGLFLENTDYQDTTYTTIFDTSNVVIYDTTVVTTYDTIQVFDTTFVNDTTFTTVYDTIFLFDTTFTTIFDTTFTTIFDTTFTTIIDTTFTSIFDTTFSTIFDTTHIAVTDTLYLNVKWSSTGPDFNRAKIYPNPSNDKIIVDFGDYLKIFGHKLIINNSSGQLVYSSNVTSKIVEIDLNSLGSAGTYTLIISDKNLNILVVKKLILQ